MVGAAVKFGQVSKCVVSLHSMLSILMTSWMTLLLFLDFVSVGYTPFDFFQISKQYGVINSDKRE